MSDDLFNRAMHFDTLDTLTASEGQSISTESEGQAISTDWFGDWDKADAAAGFKGLSTGIDMLGGTIANNQDADALREQARLHELRAYEILRRAEISQQQVTASAKAVVSGQKTALTGRGVSASGNLAAMLASDSIDAAHDEITNIDKAAKYDSYLAKAQAQSTRNAADNAESSMFGTIASIGIGVAVGIGTGNPYAGAAAAKGSKAIIG